MFVATQKSHYSTFHHDSNRVRPKYMHQQQGIPLQLLKKLFSFKYSWDKPAFGYIIVRLTKDLPTNLAVGRLKVAFFFSDGERSKNLVCLFYPLMKNSSSSLVLILWTPALATHLDHSPVSSLHTTLWIMLLWLKKCWNWDLILSLWLLDIIPTVPNTHNVRSFPCT